MFYVVRKRNQINTSKGNYWKLVFLSLIFLTPLCVSFSLSSPCLLIPISISLSLCLFISLSFFNLSLDYYLFFFFSSFTSLCLCLPLCVCMSLCLSDSVCLSPFIYLFHLHDTSQALVPTLHYTASFSSFSLQMTHQLPLPSCQHLGA